MAGFFRKIYQGLTLRLYSVGRQEYEKHFEQMLFKRGEIATDSRFYPGADIYNLANNPRQIKIGRNCHISGLLMVYDYGGSITVGDCCSLSINSRVVSAKRIEIGNRVLIAHNVNIIDNISHPLDADLRHEDFVKSYSTGMAKYDIKAEEIVIEDDVWIGFNSSVMRGVRIGRGAIIGAGSMVTKDVKPWTVNIGNPLKCIKELSPVEVKNRNA